MVQMDDSIHVLYGSSAVDIWMITATLLSFASTLVLGIATFKNSRSATKLAERVAAQEENHRAQIVEMQNSARAHEARVARDEFGAALTMQNVYDFERRRNGPNRLTNRPTDETVLLLGAKTGDPSRHILTSYIQAILAANPFARGDDRSGVPEFAIGSIKRAISRWIEDPNSLPEPEETWNTAYLDRLEWEHQRDEMFRRMKTAESKWAPGATDTSESD